MTTLNCLVSTFCGLRADHGQLEFLLVAAGLLRHLVQTDALGRGAEEKDGRRLQGRWGNGRRVPARAVRLLTRLPFASGGQRNWVQVFCNGGVPTQLALLYMIEVSAR